MRINNVLQNTRLLKKCFALLILFFCSVNCAQAYIAAKSGSKCLPFSDSTNAPNVSTYVSITLDGSILRNLQANQYYALPGSITELKALTLNNRILLECSTVGPTQTSIALQNTYSSDSGTTISESQLIDGPGMKKASDTAGTVVLLDTTLPGLYIALATSEEGYVPTNKNMTTEPGAYSYTLKSVLVIDKNFVPFGTSQNWALTSSNPILWYKDANDGSTSMQPGSVFTQITSLRYSGYIQAKATCDYSLSDGGNVDFGELGSEDITTDRTTTAKRTLTLNMNDCYAVNKVKTSIAQGKDTLGDGVILKNSLTGSDAATNIGVSINVNGSNADNAGKVLNMDGSNSLTWNFRQSAYEPLISKSINFDVLMLRTNEAPTSGKYEATATIMMEFI